jgi:RecA-family ATPase
VILSSEDGAERVLVPRLKAAIADLSRVHILYETVTSTDANAIERTINLKSDLAELSHTLAEIGNVALAMIDPITAYRGGTDSHKNTEVRAVLAPPSALAEKHGMAVLCVSHLTKSSGTEAMMRVTGSLAFVAAARAAFLVAKDKENEAHRLFLPLKVNYGDDHGGLAYEIRSAQLGSPAGVIETSRVE